MERLAEKRDGKRRKLNFVREFSSGAVIFHRNENREQFYLLLNYHFKSDYWDFPRGNLEPGEHSIEAAEREIREETGFTEKDIEFISGFKENVQWFYVWQGTRRFKSVTYFLAKAKKMDVKLSEEHLGYKWLLFDAAFKQLTHDNSKQVLKKAEEFLNKQP